MFGFSSLRVAEFESKLLFKPGSDGRTKRFLKMNVNQHAILFGESAEKWVKSSKQTVFSVLLRKRAEGCPFSFPGRLRFRLPVPRLHVLAVHPLSGSLIGATGIIPNPSSVMLGDGHQIQQIFALRLVSHELMSWLNKNYWMGLFSSIWYINLCENIKYNAYAVHLYDHFLTF